jgi:hypothetical protein
LRSLEAKWFQGCVEPLNYVVEDGANIRRTPYITPNYDTAGLNTKKDLIINKVFSYILAAPQALNIDRSLPLVTIVEEVKLTMISIVPTAMKKATTTVQELVQQTKNISSSTRGTTRHFHQSQ